MSLSTISEYFKETHFFLFRQYSLFFLSLQIRSVTHQSASHKMIKLQQKRQRVHDHKHIYAKKVKVKAVSTQLFTHNHSEPHSDLFFFKRTRSSKRLSDMAVRRLFMVSPAQLNRRSAAGSGVFRRRNSTLSGGQAVMLEVSVDREFRYWFRSSVAAVNAVLGRRVKKASSSVSGTSTAVTSTVPLQNKLVSH